MAVFKFVEWLLIWLFENDNFSFEWDQGNQSKNKQKHGIETEEIEEVFKSRLVVPLGMQVTPVIEEERLGVIGPTSKGRLIHIVFTIRAGRIRPISARPAHRKERMQYGKILYKISERI